MHSGVQESTATAPSPGQLQPAKRLLHLQQRFPLTLRGCIVLLGASAACFYYGYGELDLIFFGMGAISIALVLLSFLLTLIATALLHRHLKVKQESSSMQVDCEHWSTTSFRVPNLWFIPFASVDWTWIGPPSEVQVDNREGIHHERIRPRRRGISQAIVRRFDIGDVFGLCKITLERSQPADVQFIPSMGSLQQLHILRGLSAGDEIAHPDGPPQGDRHDMRHYVPGDPIRFILWKVFAKSRQLVIRTPEQAISRSRKTAVYMVPGTSDEASAGAARMAIEYSAFGGDWVFGADGTQQPAKTKHRALTLLAGSAQVTASSAGAGLSNFLENHVGQLGRAVVFVPAKRGPWLKRVRNSIANSHVQRVQFVVGIDALDLSSNDRFHKLYGGPSQSKTAHATTAEVEDLAAIVEALGTQLLIVDRQQGHAWTAPQLHHLLAATSQAHGSA